MADSGGALESGARFGRGPVGWIALLVLLVYALACLVLATAPGLRDIDRSLLTGFVVVFPVLILAFFVWPVMRRSYASSSGSAAEVMDEATFLAVMSLLLNAQLDRAGNERSVLQMEETAAAVFAAWRRLETYPQARQRILWVDDQPDNTVLERQAFERIGIRVDSSRDTEHAQGRLRQEQYGAIIISDASDQESPGEAYALLEAIRSEGDTTTPLFVYTGSNHEDHRLQAMNRGAQDATSRPSALFDMVMRSLV